MIAFLNDILLMNLSALSLSLSMAGSFLKSVYCILLS